MSGDSTQAGGRQDPLRRGGVRIARRLRARGHEAYFAGGSVRDRVLGRPVKDYDIATSATPEEVQAAFRRTVPVGVQFGVVIVVLPEGEYQVATFRADTSYSDGRRPDSVSFVGAREDVARRDFTINGLLEDPETGEVRDFVGGLDDIRAGVVRAIGDPRERFTEDHLRILRAIRFSAVLGFDIDAATFEAILEMGRLVRSVSGERIRAELQRMFIEGDPARAHTLLHLSGVLKHVLPEAEQPRAGAMLQVIGPSELPDALAVLLGPGDPERARRIGERLRLTRDERVLLEYLVRSWPAVGRTAGRAASTRLVREPAWPRLSRIARADLLTRGADTEELDRLDGLLAGSAADQLHPRPLLCGTDLAAMGLRPGPIFGRILTALEDAQIEGTVTTREEAEALARTKFP